MPVPGLPEEFVLKEIHLSCRGYCPKTDCRAALVSTSNFQAK